MKVIQLSSLVLLASVSLAQAATTYHCPHPLEITLGGERVGANGEVSFVAKGPAPFGGGAMWHVQMMHDVEVKASVIGSYDHNDTLECSYQTPTFTINGAVTAHTHDPDMKPGIHQCVAHEAVGAAMPYFVCQD
jgi:hypothetical protein